MDKKQFEDVTEMLGLVTISPKQIDDRSNELITECAEYRNEYLTKNPTVNPLAIDVSWLLQKVASLQLTVEAQHQQIRNLTLSK